MPSLGSFAGPAPPLPAAQSPAALTDRPHGAAQRLPLLERDAHFAAAPEIITRPALLVGQSLLGLLQLLEILHCHTDQKDTKDNVCLAHE